MRNGIVVVALFFAMACSKKENKPEERAIASEPNDLPAMQIVLLDGKEVKAKELVGKNVLILFQPDCDHCQHEAVAIEENLAAFRDYTVYFVSSAASSEIKKFSNDYKLSGIPNILFGTTTLENVLNNFGAIQAPSIYIYSPQGKLVQHFNGQTDIGVIMKYL
jgi:peroxiredoxin